MTDRQSEFRVDFQGTGSSLQAFLGVLKRDVRSVVADMQASANTLQLFKVAQASAEAASGAFKELSAKAAEYRAQIEKLQAAGAPVPKALTEGLKAATKALSDNFRELNRQTAAVEKYGAVLGKAGVDVSKLAAEEARLAAALKVASAAETERQARAAIGLRTLKDITPEVQKLHAAYNTLSTSGSLSTKELAAAQQVLKERVAELRSQVTQVGQAAKVGGANLVGMFQHSVLPALGLTATFAGVVGGINASVEAAKQFQQRVAEIGTVTNLTRAQLEQLGLGARALARELGVDVDAALRGLFELIRSGVPTDNALEVLRLAAVASKASLADLSDGVKAADALIGAFGIDVKDLGPALDAVVQASKNGGATLKEFADNAGPLLSVARAANVPLNQLIATLTVMVDANGNAGQSISELTKIIQRINTAEARDKLRGLGIEGQSLVDIFRQIGERGLALDQILDLGVASTRAAAGVAALTNNATQLPAQLDSIGYSAGIAAKGVADLFDSPKARADRFSAELQDASINIGNFVGAGSRLASVGTAILREFNQIPAAFREASSAADGSNRSFFDVVRAFLQMDPLAAETKRNLQGVAEGAKAAGDESTALAAKLQAANTTLRDFGPKLLADIQAIQQASARDIADAQARADAQIAALDRTAAATRKTAEETLAIQTKLAADRFAIIVKEEADVTKLLEKAIAARTAVARKAGEDEKKIAADNAQIRINALAPVQAQYQAHYNALVQQAQAFAAKQESLERSRVDLNRTIEAEIRTIRNEGLSGLDQFVEKNKEVNRLISEGRRAAAQGDTEAAKQFFQQAIQESKGLTSVINADGVVIVTALQARTTKTEALRNVANAVNESLGDQGDAAKRGALATNAAIDLVLPKLNDLKNRYDDLKRDVDAGLQFKAKVDQDSVAAATATLDELAKPRETVLTVHVRRVEENAAGGLVGTTTGFARGGAVGQRRAVGQRGEGWRAVQAFAGGGPVFRIPRWNKVPGIGDEDTQPAALRSGSYVIRKRASKYYGDGLMRALALARMPVKRFAIGGEAKTRWDPFWQRELHNEKQPTTRKDGTTIFYKADGTPEGAFFGDVKAGTQESQRDFQADIFREPDLPKDARQLERLIIGYSDAVIVAARQIDGSQYWGPAIRALTIDRKDHEQRPTAEKLAVILRRARGIGLNLGITTSVRQGFDVDGRRFHKRAAKAPAGLANARLYSYDFYARGGGLRGLTDTVRALLTPGEHVMQPRAVRKYGTKFMDDINNMRIPKGAFAGMFAPPRIQPQRIQHFAEGGLVGDTATGRRLLGGDSETGRRLLAGEVSEIGKRLLALEGEPRVLNRTQTNNITIQAGGYVDEAWVRRFIVPVLDDMTKRKG